MPESIVTAKPEYIEPESSARDTPKEAAFRAIVREDAERGFLHSPTELNSIMGDWHRYNHLSGRLSKIRIEEFKRVGAVKDRKGHWMVGPLRTMPDGSPCWCVSEHDPAVEAAAGRSWHHSAVCRHHQLRMQETN